MSSINLGRHTVNLVKPSSFATMRDVTIAVGQHALRGLCAALGVCWGSKPLKVTPGAHKWDMLSYGGAVLDELMALGIPESEIYAAGKIALDIILEAIPREDEVASTETFTDPQTVASTL
jgi:hypothetical protein